MMRQGEADGEPDPEPAPWGWFRSPPIAMIAAPMDARAAEQRGPILGGWYWLAPIVVLAATRGFWAPDEPRYGQIAKEMFDGGSFLVLHLCGELYPDKPPLVYWLAGLSGRLTDWSELAMRVPSILATLGSAWLAARIARRWLAARVAAWVVCFTLGTLLSAWIGGRLQLDPVLTFFCLAALDRLTDEREDGRAVGRRTLLAGLLLGLAALAKGPPAWVPVGLALLVWRFLPPPLRFAPRRPAWAWIGFVILALAPVATWALLAINAEPALAEPLLFGQHVGRITSADKHPGPPWYHLASFPLYFLPWTFLLASALPRTVQAFRAREHPGLVRFAAWFAAVFVFFSVIPPKRELYLLPIYAAAAVVTAFAFVHGRVPKLALRATALVLVVPGALLAAAPLVVSWIQAHHPAWLAEVDDATALARRTVPVGLVLLAGGGCAFLFAARQRLALFADAVGVSFALALTLAALLLVPVIDQDKCARALAERVASRPERPKLLACVGVRPEGIRFYGGGPAGAVPIAESLAREGDQFLALCRDREYEALPDDVRARLEIVDRARLGSRKVLVLVRARP